MSNASPLDLAVYLAGPAGRGVRDAQPVCFRWNLRTHAVESSGKVLKSTPEQMSRPHTMVFVKIGGADGKRYA